jgi:hypothetical protein
LATSLSIGEFCCIVVDTALKMLLSHLLLLFPTLTVAFVPSVQQTGSRFHSRSALASTVVTGPMGVPAKSFEEDLRLTLAIIMDHQERSTTASKEQFLSQMQEANNVETSEPIDVSVPYHAAAMLAYEKSDKSMAYKDFEAKYEADAVAAVIAKQPKKVAKAEKPASEPAAAVDLSVPYDAAAKLAYEKTDKSMPYDDFKKQYEQQAVADVIAKKAPKKTKPAAKKAKVEASTVDLAVPYHAAAMLAYEKSDKSMKYEDFQQKYEADAVADVIAKRKK